ncbi:c-type cytochrome biogenesis protein CcsB [Georgenia sp. Z1344]|uniref:c-type cytochrome biogenesis protein CcsB n=1 Tax=Georgenia sp. Z1344 TaxID=3416706 RepID=UPI003CE912A5
MPESTLAQICTLAIYGAMGAYVISLLAFAVDLARFMDSSDKGRRFARIGVSAMVAGFAIHVVGVLTRAIATERVPWANMYEFSIVFTLIAVGIFLLLNRSRDLRVLGAGVAGLVVLSLGLAVSVLYVRADGIPPALDSYWLIIHVFVATLAVGVLAVSAILSLVQLLQERAEIGRARRAEARATADPAALVTADGRAAQTSTRSAEGAAGRGEVGSDDGGAGSVDSPRTGLAGFRDRLSERLPSSAELERMAFQLIAIGFVLWTFTLIAGAIWAEHAWGRPWGWDVKEVWTLLIWIVYAAYLHARLTRGWEGRRAAYLSLTGFGLILGNYFIVNLFLNSRHAYSGIG